MRNKKESEKSIKLCQNRCVICGWNEHDRHNSPLVEGAHIKPLEYDDTSDLYDNIIALCPNHHTLFDSYMFYIDPQTMHTVFMNKSNPYHNIDLSQKLRYVKKEYLAYRQYLYNKQKDLVGV